MTMTEADRRLDEWLRGLRWSLDSLPVRDRDDIVEETRCHITERLAAGDDLGAVLDGFGPADRYARNFVDEMEVSRALGAQKAGSLLGVILRRLHRSAVAVAALALLLFLGVAAFTAGSILWFEITDPVHTGLWINDRGSQFIGIIDDPATATDRLGAAITPVAVILLALSLVLARLVLVGTVRSFSRR